MDMDKRNRIFNIIDLYEVQDLDAGRLVEILAKEEIAVTKSEFEDILDAYYQGIGEEL